ncbi:MAG: hypothetical protein ACRDTM_05620 [Micromonosporaceae bacterium]
MGAGLIASRLGAEGAAHAHDGADHDHPEASLPIWAVTRHAGRYLALTGDAEAAQIHELAVGPDHSVSLANQVSAATPGLTALALHSTGKRLLVGGAEAYQAGEIPSLRPAVYELTEAGERELALAASVPSAFGVVTALASIGARGIAALVEGSDDAEQQYNAVSRVATSTDGGQSWRLDTLAVDLGEGHFGHLVASGGGFAAVTVDGAGARSGYAGAAAGGWRRAWEQAGSSSVMAVSSPSAGVVELVDRSATGAAQRHRFERGAWRSAGANEIGEPVLAVVAVSGSRGELIAIGESSARLLGQV